MVSSEQPDDRLRLRVGDADRHEVAEVLRRAAGEGRIELAELDERLEATFTARTYADLVPITSDLPEGASLLPVAGPGEMVRTGPGAPEERHTAILGGFERKGVWTFPARMRITALMGGANLDLREATYAASVCELRVTAVMGGVNLKVPEHVRVIFSMTSIMGGHNDDYGSVEDPDAPTVIIRGTCLMGGVNVERQRRPRLDAGAGTA